MDEVDKIRRLVDENLSADKVLVEVLISGKKLPKRVLVIIDGDRGVTIDDCADLSRSLSKSFDELNFFGDDNYLLEVSTPGLDHPLKLKRQYHKNAGRNLKVVCREMIVEGRLKEVTDEKIVLVRETGTGKKKEVSELDVPFSDIDKAFVLVSFK